MRVAIYARVSTEDKGQDPENQLRDLRAWCANSGHELCGSLMQIGVRPTWIGELTFPPDVKTTNRSQCSSMGPPDLARLSVPSGQHIKYVAGLGSERATRSTPRDMPSSMTRGGRPENGGSLARSAPLPTGLPCGTLVCGEGPLTGPFEFIGAQQC